MSTQELVAYRLARAWETLDDAKLLAGEERWASSANRLYYACFYAVTALLLQEGLESSKHSGVRSLFNLHFVKPGRIPRAQGRIFNDLFELRQESDYVDFLRFSPEDVVPRVPEAESFVASLSRLIEAQAVEPRETEDPA